MKEYDVSLYGAVGDGKTINTKYIQAAIDDCSKNGGGRVVVSDGVFVTGTLFMRSFVELCIEANATLKASENTDDFPHFEPEEWNVKAAPRETAKCLIYFGYINNASLCGMGKIDCSGSAFCDFVYDEEGKFTDENGRRFKCVRNTLLVPARMIFIMGCTNINVENITMLEMAGGWGYWVNNSQYVTFSKVKLYCNPRYPNADGIHINCSSDVLVDSSVIHSGDDSIIIRANTNTLKEKRVCERVVVKGCTLSSACQAVRVGWRNDGIVRDCIISDCIVTNSRTGMKFELPYSSSPTDIGENATVLENIHVSNVVFDSVEQYPILMIVHENNMFERIKNIRFSNITASSGLYPVVKGRSDAIIEEIYFDNCKFTIKGNHKNQTLPFANVKGLHLNNTTFDVVEEDVKLELFDEEYKG